jgi:hypothetical protein
MRQSFAPFRVGSHFAFVLQNICDASRKGLLAPLAALYSDIKSPLHRIKILRYANTTHVLFVLIPETFELWVDACVR